MEGAERAATIEAKVALRTVMRRRRQTVSDRVDRSAWLRAEVRHVCDHVAAFLATDAAPLTVLAFQGVGSEPDMTGLVELLDAAGFTVLLPRVEGDHIVGVPCRPGDVLRTSALGIPEPLGPAVDPSTIDVVLVPGLAFTADGRRLGQGGGFYDRFLPLLRADCVTYGVCFAEQVVADLPSEPHDQRLSGLITDGSGPEARGHHSSGGASS